MFLKNTKIYSLLKLFYRGYGGYKLQIIILAVLGFLGGFLEGVGINAAIPLFSFITKSGQTGDDVISRGIAKAFAFFDVQFGLRYLLVFICLLFIARAVALFFCNYIKIRISANYEEQARRALFAKTLEADWPYLLKYKLGHLNTLLITNVQYGSLLLEYLSGSIMAFAGLLMYILVAVNISWIITLITLALGALLMFFLKPFLYKIKSLAQEKESTIRQAAHYLNENVVGLKTVKIMSAAEPIKLRGWEYFKKFKDLKIKTALLRIISDALIQPVGLVFVVIVFAFSYKAANFNFAALAAVIYLVQRMFAYIQQLQSNLYTVGEAAPYLRKLLDYGDEAKFNKEKKSGELPFKFDDALVFRGVDFFYNSGQAILTGLNFSINKGEAVGLIGSSGAGKTTLVDLILRLFAPTGGKILLDGKEAGLIDLSDWRKNIGYVSQDIFLKNDTIANNIKFYDEMISDEEMRKSAKMADIYDFIESCPDGFKTIIGERGVMLSAGQRQRIIIARILARKPKFLILDEATSALDNEAEVQIQKVIENLKGKLTVFIIAHRLTTIMGVDKLLVLADGKIVEQGKPRELLANRQSYFYKVYNIKN
ncbi:MAG: ABC transporter ATP-binding protein [bacterium]|nr:ABC transporter ATP-binding protein [bacterium]